MKNKPLESKISDLITGDLMALGYDLVRVHLMAEGQSPTLQIMAERCDDAPMTVEDCAAISHATSDKLDADDSLASHYTLEVSSPGIDRPLVRLKDFERFTGHVAKIELETKQEGVACGRKRFQGLIERVTGHDADAAIEFSTDTGAFCVPMKEIARAKLVLTEALLKNAPAHTKHL